MNKTDRKGISSFRNVSDLRIQFYCEYRLFLKQLHGGTSSEASRGGTRLHSKIAVEVSKSAANRTILILLLVIIIISAIFWIWM
ncbi:MAG: hypothetical protein GF411_11970 [Candidatus Lokiarchaeota archaeon]|nr:hypothetical protein [Candidatus Lokiarchaeota archaeon]